MFSFVRDPNLPSPAVGLLGALVFAACGDTGIPARVPPADPPQPGILQCNNQTRGQGQCIDNVAQYCHVVGGSKPQLQVHRACVSITQDCHQTMTGQAVCVERNRVCMPTETACSPDQKTAWNCLDGRMSKTECGFFERCEQATGAPAVCLPAPRRFSEEAICEAYRGRRPVFDRSPAPQPATAMGFQHQILHDATMTVDLMPGEVGYMSFPITMKGDGQNRDLMLFLHQPKDVTVSLVLLDGMAPIPGAVERSDRLPCTDTINREYEVPKLAPGVYLLKFENANPMTDRVVTFILTERATELDAMCSLVALRPANALTGMTQAQRAMDMAALLSSKYRIEHEEPASVTLEGGMTSYVNISLKAGTYLIGLSDPVALTKIEQADGMTLTPIYPGAMMAPPPMNAICGTLPPGAPPGVVALPGMVEVTAPASGKYVLELQSMQQSVTLLVYKKF